jgi:DNA gyrase subunit A
VTHHKDFSADQYLLIVTKKGRVKKLSLDRLKNMRVSGLKVTELPEDDSLMDVLVLSPGDEVVIATKKGMSIRFKEEDVRPMGRAAYGVRAIRLRAKDEVVSVDLVNEGCSLFSVTENGFGKRVPCSEYRVQSRSGSGIINVRCGAKNGDVVCLKRVEQHEIILVTDNGRTIRFNSETVPVHKRGGTGVILMDLSEGEKISGVAIISEGSETMIGGE